MVPPDEVPPDEDELLEVPPEDELLEELLEEAPLLDEEVPPLLEEEVPPLLEDEVPPLLEEEVPPLLDEELELPPLLLEEVPIGGGAAPPPPPPPHATSVSETASVIDLKTNLAFSGMRIFPQDFWFSGFNVTNSVRFAISADVDGYALQGSPETATLSYRSCEAVLTVTVERDIS